MEDSIEKTWRTSSYTGNGGGNCVEVADAANVVMVRDTKDRDAGTLALSADAWRAFMGEIKSVLPRESHQGGTGTLRGCMLSCVFAQKQPWTAPRASSFGGRVVPPGVGVRFAARAGAGPGFGGGRAAKRFS
jgi:hypothetical protein